MSTITPFRRATVRVPVEVRRVVCGMGGRNAARKLLGVSEGTYAELVAPNGVVTAAVLEHVERRIRELA